MPWQVTLGDKTIVFDDLPIGKLSRALDGTGVPYIGFLSNPFGDQRNPRPGDGEALEKAVAFAAEHLGVDPPGELTARKLAAMVKWVEDDLPDTYTDGMPDPKVDEPMTESSSGSPEP